MCGRYASSRRPEDLVEEFEVDQPVLETALEPDFNVAPTKDVYAVLERPTKGEERPQPEPQQQQPERRRFLQQECLPHAPGVLGPRAGEAQARRRLALNEHVLDGVTARRQHHEQHAQGKG